MARQHRILHWTVDAAVTSHMVVLQADGEYWHGHLPGSRDDSRVRANVDNDLRSDQALSLAGWTVLRLRESELLKNPGACRTKIIAVLCVSGAATDRQA